MQNNIFTRLTNAFEDIRKEAISALPHYIDHIEQELYAGGWQTLPLGTNHTTKFVNACEKYKELCPVTVMLIEPWFDQHIIEYGFSYLMPGLHIKPHAGSVNDEPIYRCHLCLLNDPEVFINIEGYSYYWEEGGWLCFNHVASHEVYHLGIEPRLNLVFEIKEDKFFQEINNASKKNKQMVYRDVLR